MHPPQRLMNKVKKGKMLFVVEEFLEMNFIPIVVEQTGRGERAYDIYSRLLKDRIVFLGSSYR